MTGEQADEGLGWPDRRELSTGPAGPVDNCSVLLVLLGVHRDGELVVSDDAGGDEVAFDPLAHRHRHGLGACLGTSEVRPGEDVAELGPEVVPATDAGVLHDFGPEGLQFGEPSGAEERFQFGASGPGQCQCVEHVVPLCLRGLAARVVGDLAVEADGAHEVLPCSDRACPGH